MIISTILDRFAPDILISNQQTREERFRQLLTLGMVIDYSSAVQALEDFGAAKREWAARNPQWDDLTVSQQDEMILAHLDAISADVAAKIAGRQHWLGFSSGYDARLIHHGLRRSGVDVSTFTFGQPGNADYDLARLSARRGLVSPRLFDTNVLPWQLEDFDRTAPYLADLPPSPRIPVALQLMSDGAFVEPQGFANGVLTNLQQPRRRGRTDAKGIFLESNDAFGMQALLAPGTADRLVSTLPNVGIPPVLSLTLAYRLDQRIRPREFHGISYVLPFADLRWIGLWLNIPERELPGQHRYLTFLSRLQGPEFFDLSDDVDNGRAPKRRGNLELLYGVDQANRKALAAAEGVVPPRGPTSHFDYFACYRNNVSFRSTVGESIGRLRGRNLFRPSFIDTTFQRFLDGDATAERMVCGLVTIDIASQAGRLGA